MGVPAFYRWLSSKYPKIIVDCIEDQPTYVDGEEIPVDTTQPNPNGLEFDNLYLDMNGIIHPCFHPEDRAPPTTETEVFLCIFDYIDRLFAIVRPRKLLYMAIDGVAPRAKMNQQRSRRFKAAQDAKEKEEEEEKLRREFEKQGMKIPRKEKNEVFDSNTITPGTPFMHRLSVALQYYVHLRLNSDPGWRDIAVLLSDANAPGEGEHKIMSYVREQRGRPGWNPATRHCLYGLDADLIMLGLATHEPRFVILREVITQPPRDGKRPLQQSQAGLGSGPDAAAQLPTEFGKQSIEERQLKPYQFLMINVLREYLALELTVATPFPFDVERIYDDFVFMCFFCGNDFLPHMPTLEIREGAIELLMHTYKRELHRVGYLTDGSDVLMGPVEKFIQVVGALEDVIFQKRMRQLQRDKRRRQNDQQGRQSGGSPWEASRPRHEERTRSGKEPNRKWTAAAPSAEHVASLVPASRQGPHDGRRPILLTPSDHERPGSAPEAGVKSNKKMAELLRDRIKSGDKKRPTDTAASDASAGKRQRTEDALSPANGCPAATGAETPGSAGPEPAPSENELSSARQLAAEAGVADDPAQAEQFAEAISSLMKGRGDMFEEMVVHEEAIRLGEAGWKGRYYKAKTGVEGAEQDRVVQGMVRSYVEGLSWVMKYYYDGVASWTWFYPFHYAPFASDLRGLAGLAPGFSLGEPFKPFNQLMGVLPAASAHALPTPYQPLFTARDSPIRDFYPVKFESDMNGKRFAWQAVVLLPFIDEQRLLAATGPLEILLEEEEKWRNGRRLEQLYVGPSHQLCPDIYDLGSRAEQDPAGVHCIPMNPRLTGGMVGEILASSGEVCPIVIPAPYRLGEDISPNGVCCISFRNLPHQKHIPRPLPDQTLEPKILSQSDLQPPKPLWHEDPRGRGGGHAQSLHGGYADARHQPGGLFSPHGQAVGPLSQAAHRMLDFNLPASRHGGAVAQMQVQGYGTHAGHPNGQLNPHAPTFQPYAHQPYSQGGYYPQQPGQPQQYGHQAPWHQPAYHPYQNGGPGYGPPPGQHMYVQANHAYPPAQPAGAAHYQQPPPRHSQSRPSQNGRSNNPFSELIRGPRRG